MEFIKLAKSLDKAKAIKDGKIIGGTLVGSTLGGKIGKKYGIGGKIFGNLLGGAGGYFTTKSYLKKPNIGGEIDELSNFREPDYSEVPTEGSWSQ